MSNPLTRLLLCLVVVSVGVWEQDAA